jgi:hypothetical protein
VSETWADREQRMLEAICDGEEAGEEVTLASLIDRLDLDEPLVKLTLRRLCEAGYVKASIMTAWQSEMVTARDQAPRARAPPGRRLALRGSLRCLGRSIEGATGEGD